MTELDRNTYEKTELYSSIGKLGTITKGNKRKPEQERFSEHTITVGDCVVWTGSEWFSSDGGRITPRRYAYFLATGNTVDQFVYTTCETEWCIKHISLEKPPRKAESIEKGAAQLRGKKRPPEVGKKVSASKMGHLTSDETREKISRGKTGKHISDEIRKKISLSLTGRKRTSTYQMTEEHKKNISIALRTKYKTLNNPPRQKKTINPENLKYANPGKKNGRWGVSPPIESTRGKRTWYGDICFRSTYEARVARMFDAYGWNWEYETERFDLGDETYLPDFKLNDTMYVEVKGWMNDDAKRKLGKFTELFQYPISVLGLKEIKLLESGYTDILFDGVIN